MYIFLKSRLKEHMLPIIFFLFFTGFFILTTTYFPYSVRHLGFDQGAFSYLGLAMKNGLVPYTQAWDNKGPLLYLINMFAILIHYDYGMFPLEMVTLFVTMIFLYRAALFFSGKTIATIATLFSMMLLSITIQGGNMSEEFSLPFLAFILLRAVQFFFQKRQLSSFSIFGVGVSVGAIFLLRVNNLAFPVAISFVMLYALYRHKEWKMMWRIVMLVTVGCICMIAPFMFYLFVNGAFFEYVNAALFTLSGFSHPGKLTALRNIHNMLTGVNITGLYSFSILFLALMVTLFAKKHFLPNEKKYPLWFCFWGILLNLAFNCLSGYGFYHYCMTFIPILVVPLAWCLNGLKNLLKKMSGNEWKSIFLVGALVFFVSYESFVFTTNFILTNIREAGGPFNSLHNLTNYVVDVTEENDKIQVIGFDSAPAIYYHTNRLAASRYFYTDIEAFTDDFSNKINKEVAAAIIEEEPKLLLFPKEREYTAFLASLPADDQFDEYVAEYYELQDGVPNYYIAYLRKDAE